MTALLIAQAAGGDRITELVPSIGRTFAALAVVIALIAALAWLVRRGVVGRRAAGLLAIESSMALGERRSLLVVTVEGRRLLLGLAPNSISLVTELAPPPSFDDAVSRAMHREGAS